MIKNEKIVLKFIWGRAVFCDTCGTRLTRYKKVTKDEYLVSQGVDLNGPHICASCEREEAKAQNKASKAARKAQAQAQERTAKVREQNRTRKARQREREEMSRTLQRDVISVSPCDS